VCSECVLRKRAVLREMGGAATFSSPRGDALETTLFGAAVHWDDYPLMRGLLELGCDPDAPAFVSNR